MPNSISPFDIQDSLKRRPAHAGIVGNGRTCALVDSRGRVGWMCVPTFAQFPIFASLLDPVHGGRLELGVRTRGEVLWSGDYGEFEQDYVAHSNVLETVWSVAGCRVRIRDVMPWGKDRLVRDVRIENGHELQGLVVRLRPTAPTPSHIRFLPTPEGISFEETRCPARGLVECTSENAVRTLYRRDSHEVMYEFPSPDRVILTLSYAENPREETRAQPIQDAVQSDAMWLDNTIRLSLPNPELGKAFERGLLALRLLTYEPTGAVLAAATASFPSESGGDHNWDYRFCWVRDGCYTARALDQAGCFREAERIYRFLLERISDGQWDSPLWAIEPGYPIEEQVVPGLRGPGGESPVRIGNAAAKQRQHDSPGNVILGVYLHTRLTGNTEFAEYYWEDLARAADWCCDHWAELEAGIWEKRDRQRAWVHGRAMSWVGLRDASRLAAWLRKPAPDRWTSTVEQISRVLVKTGWSEARGAFLRVCGESSIYDVSALTLLLEDLVDPDDPRMRNTVEKLAQHLAYGAGFRRDEDDRRFPFYLATFWMIRALMLTGDHDRAYGHFQSVISGTTNLDLMAEYFNPLTSRQYGNFPQAFSHEELVRTVCTMLWKLGEQALVLFPAVPNSWLVPGSVTQVSNIPLGAARGCIVLSAQEDVLDFKTRDTGNLQVVVPPRFFEMKRRVRLNGVWQNQGGECPF